jgi:hypothetical protein
MCSLAARGLWAEVLALMSEAKPIGHLLVSGRAPTDAQLAVLAGAPSDQVPELLGELDAAGVFSRTKEGVIYSRRMVRDEKKARNARQNGKNGGNPTLRNKRENSSSDKGEDKGRDNTQKPEARSQNETNVSSSARMDGRQVAGLIERLIEAAGGNVVHGASGIEVAKPILDLQAMGCDLDADILPAIAETVPGMADPLRTWGAGFLRDKILGKHAARIRSRGGAAAPPPDETPEQTRSRLGIPEPKDRPWEKWDRPVQTYFISGGKDWPEWMLGPPPDAPGCFAPQDVIANHRPRQWSAAS